MNIDLKNVSRIVSNNECQCHQEINTIFGTEKIFCDNKSML